MKQFLFYIVILLANIIQGITGFAGTILAMPFSVRLVGMETAVPVLNALGLLSGVYVLAGSYKDLNRKELLRVLAFMGPALLAGVWIKSLLASSPGLLYTILGVLVLLIAIRGIVSTLPVKNAETGEKQPSRGNAMLQTLLLAASGLIHGMFVCGGPLLIAYLARRLDKKEEFRATISAVWIFLNGILLMIQIFQGQWNAELLKVQLISIPFLLCGMFIGSVLYRHMSQRVFMIITYILLLIAAVTLFFK